MSILYAIRVNKWSISIKDVLMLNSGNLTVTVAAQGGVHDVAITLHREVVLVG